MNHSLNRLLQGLARSYSAVGLDKDAESIKVGAVANTHILHLIVHTTDRREGRVKRDGTDIHFVAGQHFARHIAETAFDSRFKLERRFPREVAYMLSRVHNFNLAWELKIFRRYLSRTLCQERYGLRLVAVKNKMNAFKIQQNLHDRLARAVNRGEFMRNALNLYPRNGGAGERRENNTAQRIAERVAVARI